VSVQVHDELRIIFDKFKYPRQSFGESHVQYWDSKPHPVAWFQFQLFMIRNEYRPVSLPVAIEEQTSTPQGSLSPLITVDTDPVADANEVDNIFLEVGTRVHLRVNYLFTSFMLIGLVGHRQSSNL
jgi:hypothetical protein